MIEAYKIGVSIALQGNVQTVIQQLVREFEVLNKAIASVQMGAVELASSMRGLQRIGAAAAQSWEAAAVAMERAARATRAANSNAAAGAGQATGTYGPAPTAGGGRAVVGAIAGGAAGAAIGGGGGSGGGGGYPRLPGPGGGGGGGGGGIPPAAAAAAAAAVSPHDYATAGLGFGMVGAGVYRAETGMFSAAAELGAVKARMRMQGFTDEQVSRAEQIARNEADKTPGLTIAGALMRALDLTTVTQNPEAAISGMPSFSRLGVSLGIFGKGDQEGELYAAMQAGELRGALVRHDAGHEGEISVEKLKAFLDNLGAAASSSGGRYGPHEVLQMLRSGGLSAAALSDQALFADQVLPTLTLGAAGGGTGLQAFGMQFGAGKMSEAAVQLLFDAHMIRNPETGKDFTRADFKAFKKKYKTGVGQFLMPPDVLKDRQKAIDHPADFILQDLLPGIDQILRQHHIPVNDQERGALAQAIASRIPGGKYVGDFLRLAPLVDRERQAFRLAQGRDMYGLRVDNDPKLAKQAFDAAFHNMMATLGQAFMKDAIAALNELTKGLNAIGEWADKHHDVAKKILESAGALGVLATVVGSLSAALFLFLPALRVLKAAGLSGGAAAAGAAGVASIPWLHDAFGWIDRNVPGAAATDDWAYRHTDGWIGRAAPPPQRPMGHYAAPLPVIVTNTGDIARGANANSARVLSAPTSGTNGSDLRLSPYSVGAH